MFWRNNESSPYSTSDWMTDWVIQSNEKLLEKYSILWKKNGWKIQNNEELLDNAKKISNSWTNRNALHVDVIWEVWSNKSKLEILLDSLKWIRNDDSWFYNSVQISWKYQNPMTTYIERNWESYTESWGIDDINQIWVTVSYLEESQIYSKNLSDIKTTKIYNKVWKTIWVEWIKFVRLKDKWSYIIDYNRELLKLIEIYYQWD